MEINIYEKNKCNCGEKCTYDPKCDNDDAKCCEKGDCCKGEKCCDNEGHEDSKKCCKENDNCNKEKCPNANENIEKMGCVETKSCRGNIFTLTVVGQIEGHSVLPPENKTTKYEHVIPKLVSIEEDENIDGLLVILNTVGGDVEAGLAISEMIASMKKPSVSLVLGGGHSIGVPLAVSSNYSFIAPSASMTIHPVRMNGMFMGVPQVLEYFNRMQDRVLKFVTKNSRVTAEKFKELMFKVGEMANDVGSIVFGEQAVEYGLIDEIGGLSQAMDKLYDMTKCKHDCCQPKTGN